MPSNNDGGVPTGSSQTTVKTPSLPSEYEMLRIKSPERASAVLPMLSVTRGGPGRVPGPTSNLTSFLTSYVPPPVTLPLESRVSHVPPPVTFCDRPETLKVPEPVRVILDPSFALAEA